MAERFPKRSILSVMSSIASANSEPKPPKSGKATESGKSGRRRPPQPPNGQKFQHPNLPPCHRNQAASRELEPILRAFPPRIECTGLFVRSQIGN